MWVRGEEGVMWCGVVRERWCEDRVMGKGLGREGVQ